MKKATIEKYTIAALEHLQEPGNMAFEKTRDGRLALSKTIKGKAASFGPSVISIGVLPTVAFYSDEGDGKKEHRVILQAIWAILRRDENLRTAGCRNVCEYIMRSEDAPALKRDRILMASTAYKLALRTYPEEEEKT